jgi:hypothetical protein
MISVKTSTRARKNNDFEIERRYIKNPKIKLPNKETKDTYKVFNKPWKINPP